MCFLFLCLFVCLFVRAFALTRVDTCTEVTYVLIYPAWKCVLIQLHIRTYVHASVIPLTKPHRAYAQFLRETLIVQDVKSCARAFDHERNKYHFLLQQNP